MRTELVLMAIGCSVGCGGGHWEPPPMANVPPQTGGEAPVDAPAAPVNPSAPELQRAGAGARLALGPASDTLALGEGRWVVEVRVAPRRFVTVGVAGRHDALARFEVIAERPLQRLRAQPIPDDRRLPVFVSFESPAEATSLRAIVDAKSDVRLVFVSVDANDIAPRAARELKLGTVQPRPLVGLPFPIEPRSGYTMQVPHRYGFVRTDVAVALRAALRQTRIRYRRNALTVGDASQWNGGRPGTDVEKARHISHEGGRDVDIALPTRSDTAAVIERRCQGVLVEGDRLQCAPGTVQGLDAERLAYFLGLLIDGPTPGGRHMPGKRPGPTAVVETIYTDQAYIDEIRKTLPALRAKQWIHDEAFGALGEDGLLRPSPWHTDHVHVRFRGESAKVPELLRFEPEPRAGATGAPSSSKR